MRKENNRLNSLVNELQGLVTEKQQIIEQQNNYIEQLNEWNIRLREFILNTSNLDGNELDQYLSNLNDIMTSIQEEKKSQRSVQGLVDAITSMATNLNIR